MYSIDLDTALHSIKVLRRYKRPDVQYALLRDLTITYVRPFSGNTGIKGKQRNHMLTTKKRVPKHLMPLHKELVRLRMEQFAHTDLTYYKPRAVKISFIPSGAYGMTFKGFDYAGLLSKLPQIEELIRTVESSVNAEIAHYEKAPALLTDAIIIKAPTGPSECGRKSE